jgi:hypothetical protein
MSMLLPSSEIGASLDLGYLSTNQRCVLTGNLTMAPLLNVGSEGDNLYWVHFRYFSA